MASGEGIFVAIKPDEARWGFRGEIIKHFQQKRSCHVSLKFTQASEDLLEEHCIDLNDRLHLADTVKRMHTGQWRPWCERGCVL